ncbi:MAG TPA: substrate-binding domain-containing protein [Holophaga sp.]|nr:substrate-binding domain-containing protein [Holophaga sp.]
MKNRLLALAAGLLLGLAAQAQGTIILATTTSTQDSGLLDVLVPTFEKQTGIKVKTIAVGSGQAMAMGRKGEADVLLVHSPDAEKEFMKDGVGSRRLLVMHNDFVVVGPLADPAGLKGARTAADAFRKLAEGRAPFVSRADKSGTHAQELKLWKAAGFDPKGHAWYLETGQGMGATLNVAAEKKGNTLADRGTWLAVRKSMPAQAILVEGDAALANIYHVIELQAARFPKVNAAGGKAFAEFLVSPKAQEIIRTFGVDKYGSPLFFPDAGKADN